MPPLMQLPAYEIKNALVNFEPLNNGLDSIRTAQVQNRKLEHEQDKIDIDRDKFGLLRDQHENQKRIQQIELMGNQALAVAQLPPGPARDVAHARLMSQHPNAASLDPRYRDSVLGPQLIAADAGKARDKLGDELKRAQINMTNSHASAYRAMANARSAPMQDPNEPPPGIGMDESGALVPLGRSRPRNALLPAASGPNESQPVIMQNYLGSKNDNALGTTAEHADYGPSGTVASSVPGIVTTSKGATDVPATTAARGQRAVDSVDDANRQRLIAARRNQEIYSWAFGKPGSGKAYDNNGKLISLERKESVTDRQSITLAQQGLENLDMAERTLTGGRDEKGNVKGGTTYLSQYAGDTYNLPVVGKVGGFGEAGRGFAAAEMAILDLNFAISGKSVSNNERQEFLRLYRPSAGDSLATQQWKIERARAFFKNALAARKAGASDDEIAGLYNKAILEGQKTDAGGAQSTQSKSAPPAATSRTGDLRNSSTDELIRRLGQ